MRSLTLCHFPLPTSRIRHPGRRLSPRESRSWEEKETARPEFREKKITTYEQVSWAVCINFRALIAAFAAPETSLGNA